LSSPSLLILLLPQAMFPPSHHPYRQPSRLFRLSLLYLAVLSNARSCPSRLTPLSVRSSRRRNAERSNALACLEGLSCVPGRIPRNSRQQNFMSMSDDEDEEADTDATGADADVEDDGDAFTSLPPQPPAPRSARKSVSSFVLPDSLTIGNVVTVTEIHSPIDEEEDCVLPPAAISALRQTIPSKPRARSRRSTLESWFPPSQTSSISKMTSSPAGAVLWRS
jgi:hypothetical protein